jgi:hypothetical protein
MRAMRMAREDGCGWAEGGRMTILAIDLGLNGAAGVLDERGDLVEVIALSTIGEGAQRRVDAANLADLYQGS